MMNDSEQRGACEALTNDREAREAREKKRVRKYGPDIKVVPSVAETVETWSWLSTSLTNELQQDLQEGPPALRDADIE